MRCGRCAGGVDLASRCGALVLAERARGELVVAGARASRAHRGRGLAHREGVAGGADGRNGNDHRQIAEALFVTIRTVTTHLCHVYQKLGVSGREQLAWVIAAA